VRITANAPPTPRELAARVRRDGFSPTLARGSQASSSAAVHPVTSVDMLVALAAVDSEAERRRRLAEQTEKGLRLLELLNEELEAGEEGEAQLQELAIWSESIEEPEEPDLRSLVNAIRVRALVEQAKRERDGGAD